MIALPAGKLTPMVGAYLTEQTGIELAPGTYEALMVVDENNEFMGGVVFNNERPGVDVHLSVAAETIGVWQPHVLRAVFKYVFDQLGVTRCTSITTKGNKKARGVLKQLGFELEGNIRLGYDGRRDALIYGLLRSECRYLAGDSERENGIVKPESPGSTGPRSDGASAVGYEREGGDVSGEPEPDRPVHAAGQPDLHTGWY